MSTALTCLVLAVVAPIQSHQPTLRFTLGGHGAAVRHLAFHPNGKLLASASDDGTVKLWDVRTGSNTATLGHPAPVRCVSFSHSGRRLAAGCQDGTVKVWQVSSGKLLHTIKTEFPLRAVWFPGDDLGLGEFGLDWFEADTLGVTYQSVPGVKYPTDFWVLKTATLVGLVRRGGDLLHFGVERGGGCGPDYAVANHAGCTIELTWCCDSHLKPPGATLRGHAAPINELCFRPHGGRELASASADGTVRLWDVVSGYHSATLCDHIGPVHCVCFDRDGALLASGGEDATIRLYGFSQPPPTFLTRLIRWLTIP